MIKIIGKMFSKSNKKNVKLFSESPLKTSFYEELQKNEWCNIVNDRPEKLVFTCKKKNNDH